MRRSFEIQQDLDRAAQNMKKVRQQAERLKQAGGPEPVAGNTGGITSNPTPSPSFVQPKRGDAT